MAEPKNRKLAAVKGGLNVAKRLFAERPDEGALSAIRSAGRTAHEQEAAIRAARTAQAAEQMAKLPPRSKKANEALGLYHPVGGGIKLSRPTSGMNATTVADPQFKPPEIGIITPEQLVKEEAALFPLVGDRAAAGRYLTHVGENELETPVRLTGGPRYMDANYNPLNPEESAAWESGLGRVTALGRQAERAGEGGRPVYGIYTAGSGTNTDFNIMGANALLQQIPFSKITKKAEKEFDRAMKEGTKEFPPIPDWPGIRSPEAQTMLLDKSNGIVRTKLFGTMGKENFQSMGFPDVPATRKAIIEPELLDVPTNQAGFRLARMDTTGRIIENPAIPSDYPTAMAGQVAGKLDVPADYKDIFQSHFDARRLLSQPESGDYYSFSRAHPIQYADDAWLNRLMEQRFATERKIKEGEYKEGGEVDIEAADARLEAAVNNRMAKGGEVDIAAADARLTDAINARMGMAEGGEAGFKKIQFMQAGGKPKGRAGAIKGAAQLGKRLFADRDILPAAERDANLAKFLEGSKAPPTVYHSTSKDFNQFSAKKLGQNTKHPTTKLGFFTAADPASTEDFITSTSGISKGLYEPGANVMPLHLSIKNPYEIPSTQYLLQSMALQNMKKKDADKFVQEFIDSVKAEGHDGLLIKANPRGLAKGNEFTSDNWVAFEPTQIKSSIGNRGTYDIEDPDITKAQGGLAMQSGGRAGAIKGLGKIGKRLLAERDDAKIIQAPTVIIPSKLSNVKEAVRQSKGDFGARRVERAADEIPNLERMYKEEGLRSAFTGDNAQAVMTMNPADFEKFAKGLSGRTRADIGPKMAELANRGEIDKYTLPTDEYIQYLRGLPEGFDDVPFLSIDKEEFGLPLKPFISGHEGRHRSRALAESGQPTSLIRLVPRAELREPLPRRSQEEYLQALREELDLTGNLVLPEGRTGSPIVLPDIYAEGGDVHMADGGRAGAVKGLAQISKRLLSERTPLPAAEREANLAKFLEPSKTPMRLYHGTTATEGGKREEAIRRIKPSKEGSLGSGVYLTPNTAHASGYSGIPNDEAISAMLESQYHADTGLKALRQRNSGEVLPAQEGGNMLPVYAQLRNPLVIEGKGDPMIEALTKLGMDEDKAIRMVERAYENKGYIGKEVETRARAAGYDGLMQYRDGELGEVVSYNPNAVKSAIGNEGTYDTSVPDMSKAEGGAAFKKLSFYDKGGITTSGGTFTAEELGITPEQLNAPLISPKRMRDIKANAADLAAEGKQQLEKEYRQLGQKGGKKDFAIRVGSQILGGVPDLINLGLEGVDLIQSAIPGLGKAASVLDTAGTGDRIPKFRLASDEPWLGSQMFMRKFKEAELLGDKEFPLTELATGIIAPAATIGAINKGRRAYKGAKAQKDAPNKRRGGLTAMTR
jgi:hypothetical protein